MKKTTDISIKTTFALSALMLIPATSLRADVLASYDMQETDGAAITAASYTHADIAALNLTPAGSHVEHSGKLQLSGDPADDYITYRTVVDNGTDVATAISASAYFYLTLTPAAGKSMTITDISFDAVAGTAGPSTRSIYLMSSKAGPYEAGNELLTASTTSGVPLIPYNTADYGQNYSVDVSGISGFANITGETWIRFYIQTPGTHQNIGFDDITISGSVIPEPTSIALMGMSVVGAVFCRRLRK